MGGYFTEDPDLLRALGKGGGAPPPESAFQEDPELLQVLSRPGRSTTGGEVDPSIPPQRSSWDEGLSLLADARDRDLAANGGIAPTERMAEAAYGVGLGPGARAGGSYLGNMGRNAISGGVQGGLAAYRGSDNPLDWLEGAGRGALAGAALTGAGQVAGAAGSKVAQVADNAAGALGRGADEARVLSTGKAADDVERLGVQGRQELAEGIESNGLNDGWGPATPKTYARNSKALMNRGDVGMRAGEDAINELPNPPQVPVGDIITSNRNVADRTRGLADPANEGVADFRGNLIDRLENDTITPGRGPTATMEPSGWNGHEFMQPGSTVDLPSGQLPWDRALEQRRNLDQNTNWQQQGANEPWNNATRKEVGGQLRGAIDESLNVPNVPPEAAQTWRQGRDQYALGAGVREDSLKAMGNAPGMKIPTSMRGAVGGAAGPAVRYGGYSALAGGLRGGQSMAQGAEGIIGENAEFMTGAAIQGGGAMGSAVSQNQSVKDWFATKGISMDMVPQQGRGNQLAAAAQQLLETEPQVFGQYQQQIQEAAQKGPEALNSLIGQLEGETPFRTGPMLRLQHMSAGAQ